MSTIALRNENKPALSSPGSLMENVLIKGDLSKLTPQERSTYYLKVCESVGLNPLTKPFEYITLNGKLTLYALRTCTDQLRTIHGVSVEDLAESEREGVFIVTAKVRNKEGRTDIAKGAVNIANLKGDALANAMMKAETKAKRRATLSVCGLGFLDETEIETIPASAKAPAPEPTKVLPPHDPGTGEIIDATDNGGVPKFLDRRAAKQMPAAIAVSQEKDAWLVFAQAYLAAVQSCKTLDEADSWAEANDTNIQLMKKEAPKLYARTSTAIAKHRASIARPEDLAMHEAENSNVG